MALHGVTWSMVVWCTQDLRRDGCSSWSTSHASAVSTPLRWILEKCAIKLVPRVEPHASAVSLLSQKNITRREDTRSDWEVRDGVTVRRREDTRSDWEVRDGLTVRRREDTRSDWEVRDGLTVRRREDTRSEWEVKDDLKESKAPVQTGRCVCGGGRGGGRK